MRSQKIQQGGNAGIDSLYKLNSWLDFGRGNYVQCLHEIVKKFIRRIMQNHCASWLSWSGFEESVYCMLWRSSVELCCIVHNFNLLLHSSHYTLLFSFFYSFFFLITMGLNLLNRCFITCAMPLACFDLVISSISSHVSPAQGWPGMVILMPMPPE
jgi:hypothetical protein